MYSHHDEISDMDFLRAFENRSLDPAYFDHVGHMRLACLYLESRPLEDAITATCEGIRAYAESLGAAMKFHRTITEALVRIIDERRCGDAGGDGWRDFVEANRDLLEDCVSVLEGYYSQERLFSEKARKDYLPPDKRQLR